MAPPTDHSQQPESTPQSAEAVSRDVSQTNLNQSMSIVASEVAEDVTLGMFDGMLGTSLSQISDGPEPGANSAELAQAEAEQLRAELACARSELEFANLKEEELNSRYRVAQEDLAAARRQVQDAQKESAENAQQLQQLQQELASARITAASAQGELKAVLEQQAAPGEAEGLEHTSELQLLRAKVRSLEENLASADARLRAPASGAEVAEGSEEGPLLQAAYQQISVLNTQLSVLYTDLTMARAEAHHGVSDGSNQVSGRQEPESGKQNQQIAELVSDIRHLQLDLQYHQQKLEQMLQEKQQMMSELQKSKADLAEARQKLEEREQMLQHQEVDLVRFKEMSETSRSVGPSTEDGGMLLALRTEAAAKDSALIVSHYELHKEKLLRDRVEKKNVKLIERMQKLMMVVESMRKDNVTLERTLANKERLHEEKEMQFRKNSKKVSARGPRERGNSSLELEAPQHSLPPVDGRSSGFSTPRGLNASPYR